MGDGLLRISDEEYDKLVKRLEFFDTTRNKLLSFSFTAVLTALGVSLGVNFNIISVWICLMPFGLIIPFTGRISYYRIAHAHISTFLEQSAPEKMRFEAGTKIVPEDNAKNYRLIAWLINHEMLLLGITCDIIFIVKYINCIETWYAWNFCLLIIPIVLTGIVYVIIDSTYDYKEVKKWFAPGWEQYMKDLDVE